MRELKTYTKTDMLAPEQVEVISVAIPVSDLSYWDEGKNGWALEEGGYNIEVGASSRDIRLSEEIGL